MDEGQYWEGLASLLDKNDRIDFISRPLGEWPLDEEPQTLAGLKAFSHDYLNYRQDGDSLIVTDLRLGMADNLAFQFVFAEKDKMGNWQLLKAPTRHPTERNLEQLDTLWQRLKGDQSINANLQRLELSSTN